MVTTRVQNRDRVRIRVEFRVPIEVRPEVRVMATMGGKCVPGS